MNRTIIARTALGVVATLTVTGVALGVPHLHAENQRVAAAMELTPPPMPAPTYTFVTGDPADHETAPATVTPALDDAAAPIDAGPDRTPPTTPGSDWDGLLVGDVIVCPPGLDVAIDEYPDGTTWAACM